MRFPVTKVVQVGGPGGGWQFKIIDPRTGAVEEVSDTFETVEGTRDVVVHLLDDLLSSAHNRKRAAQLLRRRTEL